MASLGPVAPVVLAVGVGLAIGGIIHEKAVTPIIGAFE